MAGADVKCAYSTDLMAKFDKMRESFEAVVSEQAKVTIGNLLNEINALSDAEKLVLYLQLPDGVNNHEQQKVVPPVFHINNQLEQSQAFTWIMSHLEMDKDTCLRKDEVFEDYENYCKTHNMKPLNTADFGKVMKRAFPDVKPRRLGMRGQSKYCYGGLRKKTESAMPVLPNIVPDEEDIKDKLNDMLTECTSIVVGWAETVLGQGGFVVLRHLAEYLVANRYTDSRSIAAMTLRRDGYKYVDEDGVTLDKFRYGSCDKLLPEASKAPSDALLSTRSANVRRESPLTSSTEPGSIDTCDGGNGSVFNTPNSRRSLPSQLRANDTSQVNAPADSMIPPQAKRELLKLPGVFPKGKTRSDLHGPLPTSCASNPPTIVGDILQGPVQPTKTVYEPTLCKFSPLHPKPNSVDIPGKVAYKRRSVPLSSTSSNDSDVINVHSTATPNKRARLSLDSAERPDLMVMNSMNPTAFGSPSVVRDSQQPTYSSVTDYGYRRPPSPNYAIHNEPQFTVLPNTANEPQMMPNSAYGPMMLSSDGRSSYLPPVQGNVPVAPYGPAFASQRVPPNAPAQRSRSPSAFASYRPFSPCAQADAQQFAKRMCTLSDSPFESARPFNPPDIADRNCFQPILTRVGPSPGPNPEQFAPPVDQFQSQQFALPNFAGYANKSQSSEPGTPPKPDSTSSSMSVGVGSPQQISDSSAEQQSSSSILQDTTLPTDQLSNSLIAVNVNPTSNILSPTAQRERRLDVGTPEEHRVTSTTREFHDKAPLQGTKPPVIAPPPTYTTVTANATASSTDSTRVASVIQSCLSILKDLDPEYVTMYEQQQLGFRQRLVGPVADAQADGTTSVSFAGTVVNLPNTPRVTQANEVEIKPNLEPAGDKLRKDELNTPTPPNSQYSSSSDSSSSDLTSGMSTSNNASSLISSVANTTQQLQDYPASLVTTNNNVRKPTLPACSLNAFPHS